MAASAQFIQSATGSGAASNTVEATFAVEVTMNDLIIVGLYFSSAVAVVDVYDTMGNFYQSVSASVTKNAIRMQIFYAIAAIEGDTTVTVEFSGVTNSNMAILEYSHIDTVDPLHAQSSSTGNGILQLSGLTAMTTATDMLLFGMSVFDAAPGVKTAGGGYTQRVDMLRLFAEDQMVDVDDTYFASTSCVNPVDWCCQIAVFAAKAGEVGSLCNPWSIPFGFGLGLTNTYLPVLLDHPEISFTYTTNTGLAATYYPSWGGKLRSFIGTSLPALAAIAANVDGLNIPYDALAYNLEANGLPAELADIPGACEDAMDIADFYGKDIIIGIGGKLFDENTADMTLSAPFADYWLFQMQRQQINPPGETYKSEVLSRINYVLAGNPTVGMIIQISDWRGHYGGLMTSAEMAEYIYCLAELCEEEGLDVHSVNLFDNKDPAPPAILWGVLDLFTRPEQAPIYKIVFVTRSVGFLSVRTTALEPEIWRTVDGGYSWHRLPDKGGRILSSVANIFGLAPAGVNHIMAVGDNEILSLK